MPACAAARLMRREGIMIRDPDRAGIRPDGRTPFRPRSVGDVMIRHIQAASPSTTIVQAYEMMMDGNFHHLPVVDERGALVGVVSEKEVLRAIPPPTADAALLAAQRRLLAAPIRLIMTSVPTVSDTDSLGLAIDRMVEDGASALAVVDAGSRPVGIITPVDVAMVFSRAPRLARVLEGPDC